MFWEFYANGRGSDPTMFERIGFLNPREMERETHFIVDEEGMVVADAAIEQNPYDNSNVWLKHIFVTETHRRRGLASLLIENIHRYCSEQQKSLTRSSATDMGAAYLPTVFERCHILYPDVDVRDPRSSTLSP